MADVFVLAEHRQGKLRDVTFEMLTMASGIAGELAGETVAVLIGGGVDSMANRLAAYADKVLYVDDPLFADYNSEKYQKVLSALVKESKPRVVMVGHTAQGVDMAPALAVELSLPFLSDVVGLSVVDGRLALVHQFYQGKVKCRFYL